MSVRYLFNTAGNYVAFISGSNVFTPAGTWLGVITHGNLFYDTYGVFKGYVMSDDRVIYNPAEPRKPKTFRPPRPARPFRPLRPLRRLRMLPPPHPYKDYFADAGATDGSEGAGRSTSFDRFLGASLVASDGKFIGNINTNRFDPDSLTNQFGNYGNKYNSDSLFNAFGTYGNPFGPHSPFNQFAQPVKVIKDGEVIGQITKNTFFQDRTDPNDFMKWLATL